jgi:hypothetical protein
MNSFVEIIDAFGGAAPFGEAIGIPDSHARAMKARKSIPDGYWMLIVDAAKKRNIKGVTLESFASLAKARLEESKPRTESAAC